MNDNIEIDDLIGQNIQGYQIVQRIGTSTVFLAYQDTPDKQFALKIFYPDPYACNRTEILERIQSIIPLRHKNIVTVYQAGETEKFIYAVMEYIPGENLYDLMQRNPRLHWGAAAELALEITHGLVYAQDHSITHRALHPDRVLLGTQGQIKINFCNEGEITPTPEVANYVAPEFFLGETLNSSADIYALGAIIYHIVTGNAPLSGDTPKDIIRKHREAEPVLPNYGVADIPHSLSLVLSRALTADVKLRYQNAYELQAALHNFLLNDIKNYKLGSYKSLLPIVVEVSQSGRAFSQALDLEKVRKSITQRIETPQVENNNAENNNAECNNAECNNAECNNAECNNAECNNAECNNAENNNAENNNAENNNAENNNAENNNAECNNAECNNAENNNAENNNAENNNAENNNAENSSIENNNEAIDNQKVECNEVENNNKIEEQDNNNNIDSKNENDLIDTSNKNEKCCIANLQSLKKQVYLRYFLSLFLHIIACIAIFSFMLAK